MATSNVPSESDFRHPEIDFKHPIPRDQYVPPVPRDQYVPPVPRQPLQRLYTGTTQQNQHGPDCTCQYCREYRCLNQRLSASQTNPKTESRKPKKTTMSEFRQDMLEMFKMQKEADREQRAADMQSMRELIQALKPNQPTIDSSIPIPRRQDKDQDIEDYLPLFEEQVTARGVPFDKWAATLKPLLSSKYSDILITLTTQQRTDYTLLTAALKKKDEYYTLQAATKFFNEQKLPGETFPQYGARLSKYAAHFTSAAEVTPASTKAIQIVVTEKFIDTLPYLTQTYVRERSPESLHHACFLAEQHFGHHRWSVSSYIGQGKWHQGQQHPTTHRQYQQHQNDYNQCQQHPTTHRQYQQHQNDYNRNKSHPHELQQYGNNQGGQQTFIQQQPGAQKQSSPQSNGGSKSYVNNGNTYSNKPAQNVQKPDMSSIRCWKCGEFGHYSHSCKAKVNCRLLKRLDSLSIDEQVFTKGVVAGKPVDKVMLDTGADMCAVASDLVPPKTKPLSHIIVHGVTGTHMTCPRLPLPCIIKDKRVTIKALAVPRSILKHDLLLGRDTPRLKLNDWDIEGDEDWDIEGDELEDSEPQSDSQPTVVVPPSEPKSEQPAQINQVKLSDEVIVPAQVKPKDPVTAQVKPKNDKPFPVTAKPIVQLPDEPVQQTEEPGPLQVVDIGVLTRAQANRERVDREDLELLDLQAEAIPTPLGDYPGDSMGEDQGEDEPIDDTEPVDPEPIDPELVRVLQEELPESPYTLDSTESKVSAKQIAAWQLDDPSLKQQLQLAKSGTDSTYFVNDKGVLCKSRQNEFGEKSYAILAPTCMRRSLFKAAHSDLLSGHFGAKNTAHKLQQHFTWPGMFSNVKTWCAQCHVCQKFNPIKGNTAPLQPLPTVHNPWEWIALDIVGPMSRTSRGNKYLLTCIDLSTRYPEAIPIKSTDTKSLIEPLMTIFSQHGFPLKILSDQGTNFMSNLFTHLCNKLSINHVASTPYRQQSNGCLERWHRSYKACLDKCPDKDENWDVLNKYILFAIRECPNRSTGFSPFTLMYGRPVRGPLAILSEAWKEEGTLPSSIDATLKQLKERLEIVSSIASTNDSKSKAYQKEHFDLKATAQPFEIGTQVLVKVPGETGRQSWKGPYIVMDTPSPVTYELNLPSNHRKSRVFHRNCLKQYISINSLKVMVVPASQEEDQPDLFCRSDATTGPIIDLSHLDDEKQKCVYQVLDEFPDVISTDPSRDAIMEPIEIVTTSDYPIAQSHYNIPEKKLDAVKEEVEELLRLGIIRESKSPWASPVVIVDKKNGKIRLCVNFQKLNEVTITDNFPIPNIEAMLQRASRCSFISMADLVKGFHQLPMAPQSIPKTSFVLPFGKFEYLKMPFGIKNGPSHFQRVMTAMLANLPGVDVYIDDIIIYSQTLPEHLKLLRDLFELLRRHKITVHPEKLDLCKATLNFLGHKIGSGTIAPQEAKVQSIRQYSKPQSKKGIRSFLGITSYYRKFIRDYSDIATPLYAMTTKSAPEKPLWTEQSTAAFNCLRESLTSDTLLTASDPAKPYILATDASTRAVGAVLSQLDDAGRERPIAFYSKKLKKYQHSYTITELELLAIVSAVEHFSVYLIGTKFTILTDHRALSYLSSLKTANPRLTRWSLFLQSFTFDIRYKKGNKNGNADALSREEFADIPPPQEGCS